jgi:hypothetical protein
MCRITPLIVLHLSSAIINVYITVHMMLMAEWNGVVHKIYTQVFQLVATVLYRVRGSRREGVRKNYEHIHYNNTTNTR